MGIVKRQTIQNSLINYIGVLVGFVNVVVLFPIFLKPDEFGLTRLFISISTLSAQFSLLGTQRTLVKFYGLFSINYQKKQSFLLLIGLYVIVGISSVLGLMLYFKSQVLEHFQTENDLFQSYYYMILVFIFGLSLFNLVEATAQSIKKTVFSNFLKTIILRLIWMTFAFMYSLKSISFYQFMSLYSFSYLFIALLIVISNYKAVNKSITCFRFYLTKIELKQINRYTFFSILTGASSMLVTNIDAIMLASLLKTDQLYSVGYYAIATYICSVIFIPSNALTRIAAPQVAEFWKNKNVDAINLLYKESSINLFFFGSLIYALLILNYDSMMTTLKPDYAFLFNIVVIIGGVRVYDMLLGINSVILSITNLYRMESILAIFLILTAIGSNYLLIPQFGMLGAAIATGIVFIVYNTLALLIIYLKLRIQPFSRKSFGLILLFLLTLIISFNIKVESTFLQISLRSVLFVSLFAGLTYYFHLSKQLNELVNGLKSRFV